MSGLALAMNTCDGAKVGKEGEEGVKANEKNKVAPTYSTVLLVHGEVAPVLLDRHTGGTKKMILN